MTANFSTQQIESAITAASLTPTEQNWLRALIKMQSGTTWECALEAGYVPEHFQSTPEAVKKLMVCRWNANIGRICHKLADQLSWNPSTHKTGDCYWADIAVTWETVEADGGYKRWNIRPGFVNAKVS